MKQEASPLVGEVVHLRLGVIGNISDFGSEESSFESKSRNQFVITMTKELKRAKFCPCFPTFTQSDYNKK